MVRLIKEQRYSQILDAAYHLATQGRLMSTTFKDIMQCCGCSRSTIKHYFGSLVALRNAVVETAIREENFDILIIALTNNEPAAMSMSEELKEKTKKNFNIIG